MSYLRDTANRFLDDIISMRIQEATVLHKPQKPFVYIMHDTSTLEELQKHITDSVDAKPHRRRRCVADSAWMVTFSQLTEAP